jgi:peptidoglycan hydrolase-like protein with peptidoglycan-binding domain
MNGKLNFKAMPFEAYDWFRTPASEQGGVELEEEFGRGARSRSHHQRFAPRPQRVVSERPATQPVSRPGKPKIPPFPPPRFPPYPRRWPWGVIDGAYGVALDRSPVEPQPYPAEPAPTRSEYMRWVQSALNDVLGLQLPVHGVADSATRSAIRSFQQREGLPIDGVVGPDTGRALLAARSGKWSQQGAPRPSAPTEPNPTEPATELNFEWEDFAEEFDHTRRRAEAAAVESRVAAGQRDPNALTDMVFFQRHPERRSQRLGASERRLAAEWKAILRDIVLPALTRRRPAEARVDDREVAGTLAMAAKPVPGLGITLEQLLTRHKTESGGIPVEVLLAFIRFEAGRLFDDATAGKWNENYKKYIPSFYELGVFQTPAGDHGCTNAAGVKVCKYRAPGRNVENSPFGKGWRHLAGTYPTESTWKDPTMQVRVGLWDLNNTARSVRDNFRDIFPSNQSEWYLRMAVLYSFAAGAGAARALLRKYKSELLALPEGRRWDCLRAKNVGSAYFKNVDEKMALAAKIRAVRGATGTQLSGGTQ